MAVTTKTEDLTSQVSMKVSGLEAESAPERCQNPWNPGCGNTNIELYIFYEDRKIPICRSCWKQIAESDLEW